MRVALVLLWIALCVASPLRGMVRGGQKVGANVVRTLETKVPGRLPLPVRMHFPFRTGPTGGLRGGGMFKPSLPMRTIRPNGVKDLRSPLLDHATRHELKEIIAHKAMSEIRKFFWDAYSMWSKIRKQPHGSDPWKRLEDMILKRPSWGWLRKRFPTKLLFHDDVESPDFDPEYARERVFMGEGLSDALTVSFLSEVVEEYADVLWGHHEAETALGDSSHDGTPETTVGTDVPPALESAGDEDELDGPKELGGDSEMSASVTDGTSGSALDVETEVNWYIVRGVPEVRIEVNMVTGMRNFFVPLRRRRNLATLYGDFIGRAKGFQSIELETWLQKHMMGWESLAQAAALRGVEVLQSHSLDEVYESVVMPWFYGSLEEDDQETE